jgi:hypothetical protein
MLGLSKKSYTQMHTWGGGDFFIFIPLQKRHIMDTNSLANVCDKSVETSQQNPHTLCFEIHFLHHVKYTVSITMTKLLLCTHRVASYSENKAQKYTLWAKCRLYNVKAGGTQQLPLCFYRVHGLIYKGSEEFADKGLYIKKMLFPVTAHLRPITMPVEHVVAQLVEALRYKSGGHGLNSRWCHRNFSLT